MTAIDVDFDVFKALTARRTSEGVTYNEVIRELLELGPSSVPVESRPANGATFKEVSFPEGTQFRATYKGRTYTAEIKSGRWMDSDGTPRNSPSESAVKITGKNWNGWRFWHCKRPGETEWRLIDTLRKKPTAVELLAQL